jgi:ADP-dependent NAD(P)H-hydrate dehydratase / NAD(P)H-hydrate epimerase
MPPPPPLRPFVPRDLPIPSGREAAEYDRVAIREVGVPQSVLMENAGRSAALLLHHLFPQGRVVVVAGAGNNGGDGLVLARTLLAWGRDVSVVPAGAPPGGEGRLHGWGLPLLDAGGDDDPVPGAPAVVVDAILGIGLRGAPRPPQAAWIRRVNRAGVPVVALDLPSGVDADSGGVPGEAVRADLTIAFGWPKLGSLLHPARRFAGRLVAVEIGFPPPDPGSFVASLISPAWAWAHRPTRDPDTHKNAVGSLLLLAGSRGMAGAALLAGRAALRTGVGLLRIASIPENREILQGGLPEAIVVDATDHEALARAIGLSRAVAAGPGMGTDDAATEALRCVLDGPPLPTVLDADALTLAATGRVAGLAAVGAVRPLLVTPHPGEMERITGESRRAVQDDRPGAALRAAGRFHAAVLLKGTPSLVAAPDGTLRVDGGGSSDLATAGMGDVLTGTAGALLAMGAAPALAGALALQATGRGAAMADRGAGLSPVDVAEALPDALREPGPGATDLSFPFVLLDQDAPR